MAEASVQGCIHSVFWNDRYEPFLLIRKATKTQESGHGVFLIPIRVSMNTRSSVPGINGWPQRHKQLYTPSMVQHAFW